MWKRVAVVGGVVSVVGVALWFVARADPSDPHTDPPALDTDPSALSVDAHALHAELLADLRARGEPLTMAEADPPVPPDDQNGALDLELARAWWEANEPDDDWSDRIAGAWNNTVLHPWWENASPEQLDRVPEFLVFLAPLYAHVDRAARKPEIAWPHSTHATAAEWLDMDAPSELLWLMELGRILDARSIAGATPDERLAGVRAQIAIGVRYRARFVQGHLLACNASRAGAVRLRHCLETAAIDPASARDALDELLSESLIGRFPSLIQFQRIYGLEVLPYWVDGSMPAEIERRDPQRAEKGREDALTWIRWIRELDRFENLAWTSDEVARWLRSDERPSNWSTMTLDNMRRYVIDAEAAMRLGRVALASYEHRSMHGSWPESPADLAPLFPDGVPVDPFTGSGFVLEREGEHLQLRAQRWAWMRRDGDDPRGAGDDWRLPPR